MNFLDVWGHKTVNENHFKCPFKKKKDKYLSVKIGNRRTTSVFWMFSCNVHLWIEFKVIFYVLLGGICFAPRAHINTECKKTHTERHINATKHRGGRGKWKFITSACVREVQGMQPVCYFPLRILIGLGMKETTALKMMSSEQ